MSTIPVVAVVGRSNSGKTMLLEKLIQELRRRGHRVGVIKHLYRTGVAFDVPGKDSTRLAQAGAECVVLAAPDRVIRIQRCEREPSLAEVAADIHGVDLILVEGHKQADVPKIEVNRSARDANLVCAEDERLIAVVSDQRFDVEVPQFGLEDVTALADLIEGRFLGEP